MTCSGMFVDYPCAGDVSSPLNLLTRIASPQTPHGHQHITVDLIFITLIMKLSFITFIMKSLCIHRLFFSSRLECLFSEHRACGCLARQFVPGALQAGYSIVAVESMTVWVRCACLSLGGMEGSWVKGKSGDCAQPTEPDLGLSLNPEPVPSPVAACPLRGSFHWLREQQAEEGGKGGKLCPLTPLPLLS